MRKRLWAALVLGLVLLAVLAGCSWRRDNLAFTAVYTIDADLDPDARTMTYTERASVTNTGADSTCVLYFHIYGNMYKDLYKVEDGDIVVSSITDGNGNELSYRRAQKGVLYRVKLAQPLAAGESVELTFACQVIIPDLERKYGMSPDGDLQLPSFCVQLAVYDENGWDTDRLQEEGDGRYAAIADYDLTIRVPETYTLACNGTELSCENGDGVTTYRYSAEKRRDLIVIACQNYVQLERTVGNTVIRGYFNDTLNTVTAEGMEKVMDYAAFALEYYSEVFVEYPYDTLVVTNAAIGTNFAINMEYAGLITVYFDNSSTSGMRTGAYHEVAHQWFYSLVGDDENQEPWLDEGFATFVTGLCLEECGEVDVETTYWDIYRGTDTHFAGEKVNVPADKASNYDFIIYNHGCMFLKNLMDAIGREEFLSILSVYCQKYIYGIATTEDFLAVLYDYAQTDVSDIVSEYIG